ncbi:MAG: PhzF family phenazine biosynthesis protein [Marmoricola sp.]|nr:PhzF family phenazine biosynthesis protein [Marmoricola sp.]
MTHAFTQVDVFGSRPLVGNPVAVVHDAADLEEGQLADFARWTNLSETTFLLPPTDPRADYRVRILTPAAELPFAGHPTLGSAHAWLEGGGVPRTPGRVVQECGLGLVELRHEGHLSFRAPALLRSGEVDENTLGRALSSLGVEPGRLVRAAWIDNGPGWLGLEVTSAAEVLGLRPDFAAMRGLQIGVIGPHTTADAAALGVLAEVRAFCPELAVPEDPVTGSLNAGFARWLVGEGHLPPAYVVRQGTVLGRDGRVHVSTDEHGEQWVGGTTATVLRGTADL